MSLQHRGQLGQGGLGDAGAVGGRRHARRCRGVRGRSAGSPPRASSTATSWWPTFTLADCRQRAARRTRRARRAGAVDVLGRQRIGPFDVTRLAADDPTALATGWRTRDFRIRRLGCEPRAVRRRRLGDRRDPARTRGAGRVTDRRPAAVAAVVQPPTPSSIPCACPARRRRRRPSTSMSWPTIEWIRRPCPSPARTVPGVRRTHRGGRRLPRPRGLRRRRRVPDPLEEQHLRSRIDRRRLCVRAGVVGLHLPAGHLSHTRPRRPHRADPARALARRRAAVVISDVALVPARVAKPLQRSRQAPGTPRRRASVSAAARTAATSGPARSTSRDTAGSSWPGSAPAEAAERLGPSALGADTRHQDGAAQRAHVGRVRQAWRRRRRRPNRARAARRG